MADRKFVQVDLETYLREIGPSIPAVARAVEVFGDDVLELWIERALKPFEQRVRTTQPQARPSPRRRAGASAHAPPAGA